MPDYDVLTIGAGHNGLIASAYLAQAGYRVAVFERRHLVGGAVATEELVPGYRFDLGGSAHTLIRLTPIVDELNLGSFGLTYIDLDPIFFAPATDEPPIVIYRDVDRTVESLESILPGEGEAYRRFLDTWRSFSLIVRDAFLAPPGPFELGRKMMFGRGLKLPWKEALHTIFKQYGRVVDDYFSSERLKAMLVWMAAQSGPPPAEPFTAPFVLWHPLYHEAGIARPEGGSGMLTQALQRHLESHGASVFLSTPADEILVEGGRAVGIRTKDGTVTARAVLAATHARETFERLLPADHRPAATKHIREGNGFGVMLRLALDAPVRYRDDPEGVGRIGLQLLCESRHQIDVAYGQYLSGEPASDPPLVAMTFSAVDSSLAPRGGEVLWLWGQYYPYELAHGTWEDRSEEVVDRMLDAFERYAPGTREHIVGQLFQHPVWLERELGLYRGNVMHLEMSLDQMFFMRPFLGMSGYKSHLPGLYLTGASTHPGGGIMGASGRNAARILLKDLERRRV